MGRSYVRKNLEKCKDLSSDSYKIHRMVEEPSTRTQGERCKLKQHQSGRRTVGGRYIPAGHFVTQHVTMAIRQVRAPHLQRRPRGRGHVDVVVGPHDVTSGLSQPIK